MGDPQTADAGSAALRDRLVTVGRSAGLVAVGITDATPFEDTRQVLEERKAAGLAADMQFTYRNPARSTDPQQALRSAQSLVVGAWPYPAGLPADHATLGSGRPQGEVARYATSDHYADLRGALGAMAQVLIDAGHVARVLADDNALVDRAAAHRAGIGWFGKNANILVPGHGSWVVLGAVLTDARLPVGSEPVSDGCGPCRRCMDGCPTGAIIAPGVVDARRCLAWLVQAPGIIPREVRVALGGRIYGCDDCQEVCPPNRRLDDSALVTAGRLVDLIGLLGAGDDELLERHGRWYVAERNPAYLRRNALVALGNVADGNDPQVVAALVGHLAHPEAVVRAHAVWAARRLGRDDLVALVDGDESTDVVDEVRSPPPPAR